MRRLWIAPALLLAVLLGGCDDPTTVQLQNQINQDKQTISQLTQQLSEVKQGSLENIAKAQSEVNLAFAYRNSWLLQALPIWDQDAVKQGQALTGKTPLQYVDGKQVTIAPELQPDSWGFSLVAVIWLSFAVIICAAAGAAWAAAWFTFKRARWSARLAELKSEAEQLAADRQPLTDLEALIEAEQKKLATAQDAIATKQGTVTTLKNQIAVLQSRKANLQQEIELAKARALKQYRRELEEEQAKARRLREDLDKGLEGL